MCASAGRVVRERGGSGGGEGRMRVGIYGWLCVCVYVCVCVCDDDDGEEKKKGRKAGGKRVWHNFPPLCSSLFLTLWLCVCVCFCGVQWYRRHTEKEKCLDHV